MKTTKMILGLGILSSAVLLGGYTSHAAEVGNELTTADFELQAGDNTTAPPSIDPGVKPPTDNIGALTIDAVSSFVFPATKLGLESTTPLEATPKLGTKLGVQVTDARGQDIGWNLKVSATPFKTADKTVELKGAVMTIPEGLLNTKAGVDPSLTPTAHKVVLSETAQSIMTATATQGRSSWMNTFEEKGEKVTLSIPSGNKVAVYQSTLTWSLEDAP